MGEGKKVNAIAKRSPVYQMAERFQVEPDKLIGIIRGTVLRKPKDGPEPTNEELAAFIIIANEHGLNPLTREIHGFVSKGQVVVVVGIDGWTRLVNRQKNFDGCEFATELQENGITPLSVTCTMHIKDRAHPVTVTEYFRECYRKTQPWDQMPNRMLRHKAYMQCARIAFGLSGINDDDEAMDILNRTEQARVQVQMPRAIGEDYLPATPADAQPVGEAKKPEPEPEHEKAPDKDPAPRGDLEDPPPGEETPLTEDQLNEINKLLKKAKWGPELIESFLKNQWGVPETKYLNFAQGKEVITHLKAALGTK
jgi:phage recombination protein Bet